MVVVLTIQIKKDSKHNSGNTGDQGDNLSTIIKMIAIKILLDLT